MNLDKIKSVKEFKSQCKRYGVSYPDVARDCGFKVKSFQVALANGSLSRKRLNKAYDSLYKLVTRKGIEYTVRKQGLDPNATKANLTTAN